MSQPDPLPRQQAAGSDCVIEGGVEDIVGGLGHHQIAAQEVEVIQRHQKAWRERQAEAISDHHHKQALSNIRGIRCWQQENVCVCQKEVCVCAGGGCTRLDEVNMDSHTK